MEPFKLLNAVKTMRDDLVRFGAAPGMYIFRCGDCSGTGLGAKRSYRCQPCAENALVIHEKEDEEHWEKIKGRATD